MPLLKVSRCRQCGHPVDTSKRFCGHCGLILVPPPAPKTRSAIGRIIGLTSLVWLLILAIGGTLYFHRSAARRTGSQPSQPSQDESLPEKEQIFLWDLYTNQVPVGDTPEDLKAFWHADSGVRTQQYSSEPEDPQAYTELRISGKIKMVPIHCKAYLLGKKDGYSQVEIAQGVYKGYVGFVYPMTVYKPGEHPLKKLGLE